MESREYKHKYKVTQTNTIRHYIQAKSNRKKTIKLICLSKKKQKCASIYEKGIKGLELHILVLSGLDGKTYQSKKKKKCTVCHYDR